MGLINIPLYISYAVVAQYKKASQFAKQQYYQGGQLAPNYIGLLQILRETISWKYNLNPNDTGLDAVANFMYTLSGGQNTSNLTPTNPFIIIVQPVSQTINSGSNVSFSVVVAGGTAPYTYQWYFNGSAIGGATSSIYTINGATSTNAGNYYCVISDSAGHTLTSVTAALTVSVATVAVFATPVPTDPYPLTVDSYTYPYTQNVLPTANIGWNLLQADNDVNWWIFKEPVGNTVKVKYNNGTNLPNSGSIPDAVIREPVIIGGFRYYLTRIQYSYDSTQPTNLTTS